MTTPKLPPPPRSAQNRSGFSSAEARRICPSAVTTSAETRLSTLSPALRRQPADAAAERESADAGVADEAAGHREAVRLGRGVEVGPASRRRRSAPAAAAGRPSPGSSG